MKVGWRLLKGKVIKFYLEDRTVIVTTNKGNKRIKPKSIFKHSFRRCNFLKISEKRLRELQEEIDWWFE